MQFIFAASKLGQFIHGPAAHNFGEKYNVIGPVQMTCFT